jgi:hypothetical protein
MSNGPAATELFSTLDGFTPEDHSVYFFATSFEERSAHSPEWEARATDLTFVRLAAESDSDVVFEYEGQTVSVQLRSRVGLRDLCARFAGRVVYIDITGFGHHIWAPLLRAALNVSSDVRVVYVEPVDYTQSAAPTEGEIFDLSERITGIAPIPGFASLAPVDDESFHFVVLLGFEGTRMAYMLENVQPLGGNITPIVGAPGFRPEYPFYAYHGNKGALTQSRAWPAIRYVTANCPFSLFRALSQIAARTSEQLKVAPIGTKPHSLGAVLFAIAEPTRVELVYDHPIRRDKRTMGASRALVYHVSRLIPSSP